MKTVLFRILLVMIIASTSILVCPEAPLAKDFPNELYIGGFLIGPQVYSFNRFSFLEAIDMAKQAGASVIEAYPGQKLSQDDPRPFSHDATPDVWAKAKIKLEQTGIRLVNYGVTGLSTDEAANRKVFDFAKIMGIPCITTEPADEASFDVIEKLVKEYDIKIAIHNHPQPSKYWDPNYVLKCVKGRDLRIGACADTGHWMRSKIKPLEALKILEGRIISAHLKDLDKFGVKHEGEHDVPFGQGVGQVKEVLDELRRQNFDGNISIEYEHNWEKNVGEVAQCIDFVREYGKNN